MKNTLSLVFACLISLGLFGQSIVSDTLKAKELLRNATQHKDENPGKALEEATQAAQIYQKHQIWDAYTKAVLEKAAIHQKNKNLSAAIGLLEEAQNTIERQAKEKKSLVAKLRYQIAKVKDFQGDYLNAAKEYKEVLGMYKDYYGAGAKELIGIYTDLGIIYLLSKLEKPLESLTYFQLALDLGIKHYGKESPKIAGQFLNISLAHRMLGKADLAEECANKALHLYQKSANKQGEMSVLMSIGNGYNRKGDKLKALEMYKRSAAIGETISSLDAFSLSNIYGNIGSAYCDLGNFEDALKYMTKKYEANRKIFPRHHPKNARAGSAMLDIYLGLKRFEDALAMADENFIASTTDFEGAVRAEKLSELITKVDFLNPVVASSSILDYAKIYRTLYREKGDLEALKKAASVLDAFSIFTDLNFKIFSADIEQIEFRNRVLYTAVQMAVWTYHELYRKTKDKRYIKQAFKLVEQNKNILLNASLQADEATKFGEIPDSLVLEEKALSERIGKTEQSLIDVRSGKDETKIQELSNLLSKLRLQKSEFIASLESKFPKYYDFKYKVSIADIESIQSTIKDKETCFLEYFEGIDFFYVFKIDKENIDLLALPKAKDFTKELATFRQALSNFSFILEQKELAFKNYCSIGHEFYKNLLSKVLEGESAWEKIIIVPDGELGHIPFEALLKTAVSDQKINYQNLDYVLKSYAIAYSYSATLWLKNLSQTKVPSNGKLLAFAAHYKDANEAKTRLRSPIYQQMRQNLAPLPAAKEEVEALQKLYMGTFMFVNEANEHNFKELAPQYGIIHLAMHGILDKKNPILSCLAFTENSDSLEDNFLHAYELSNMNLNAGLVVLSACETGYGKFQKGEGVMSLARSFMYAGTPSLLVSLWQVNDHATSLLMQNFYEGLENGLSKDEALRQAKLEYIRVAGADIAAHPAFWAPFIQLGDSRPIQPQVKNSSRMYIYFTLGGFGLLALLFILRNRFKAK